MEELWELRRHLKAGDYDAVLALREDRHEQAVASGADTSWGTANGRRFYID